jgi:hypothetical protein
VGACYKEPAEFIKMSGNEHAILPAVQIFETHDGIHARNIATGMAVATSARSRNAEGA